MKYCYAARRHAAYPDVFMTWTASPSEYTDAFLQHCAGAGYDGLEIGASTFDVAMSDDELGQFNERLLGAEVPCVAIRAGGSLIEARTYRANIDVLWRSIDHANAIGASLVTGNLMADQRHYRLDGDPWGRPVAQDASRDASIYLYERLARDLRPICDKAAETGMIVSIELHQQSPMDTSWSALLLCELVDRPNFGINADLGNLVWNYDIPEETTEDAVRALASVSVYWHCKNLDVVAHPENERTVAWKTSLADGQMDYRFLMSVMVDAGYSGFVAIEGGRTNDQWYMDTRSLHHLRELETEPTSHR